MRTIITLLFLFFVPAVSSANTVSIGGTEIVIPNPPGFVAVTPHTPQMARLRDLIEKFVAPPNELLIWFIPEESIPIVLKDATPQFTRHFLIQTPQALAKAPTSVSHSYFLEMKEILKARQDEMVKKAERFMSDLLESAKEEISEEYNVNLDASISQIVPFPVHEETNRTIAFSFLTKGKANDEFGNPVPYGSASTSTAIHVKGKVLFLSSTAEETGLEWSRQISKQWADAVIAANPPDLQSSLKESLPSAVTGTNWSRVVAGWAVVLIVSFIGGLILRSINRRKAREQGAEQDDTSP